MKDLGDSHEWLMHVAQSRFRSGKASPKLAAEQAEEAWFRSAVTSLAFKMAEDEKAAESDGKRPWRGSVYGLSPKERRAAEVEEKRDARRKRARYYNGIQRKFSASVAGKLDAPDLYAMLGYSVHEVRAHLERQFVSGMSWKNYAGALPWKSPRKKWHVDHIVPKRLFSEGEVSVAYALTNLRPLWENDNIRKGGVRAHLI